jgi:hypothetical protein
MAVDRWPLAGRNDGDWPGLMQRWPLIVGRWPKEAIMADG